MKVWFNLTENAIFSWVVEPKFTKIEKLTTLFIVVNMFIATHLSCTV